MVKHDLAFGQKAIRRILTQLNKPEKLEHDFATAILEQAQSNAASNASPKPVVGLTVTSGTNTPDQKGWRRRNSHRHSPSSAI